MQVVYDKLVRDRIPDIIRSAGQHPVTRVLDPASYRAALLAKLTEEAAEAEQAPAGQLAAELADVLEVLHALADAHDITWDHVVRTAADKRAERGGFRDRIFLHCVETTG
jgi:predicted house-cleaning noncanonical NTP pyrophosphatase (MazG superfamily)